MSWVRRSAWCGLAAPVVLAVVTVTAGTLTPDFSHRSQVINELAAREAPYGVLMSSGIVVFGLLLIGFSPALFVTHHPGSAAAASALMIAAGGLGLAIAGVFRCNPGCSLETMSSEMALHLWSAFVAFWLLALAPVVLAVRLPTAGPGRRYFAFSLVAGLGLLLVLFSIMAVGPDGPNIGAQQRLFLLLLCAWLIASAVKADRQATV
jgi:hypothetical membrane protein